MINKKQKEKKHRILYICFCIVCISFFILILCITIIIYNVYPFYKKDLSIQYDNITDSQIKDFEYIFDDIKPIYYSAVSSMVLTNNIDKYKPDCNCYGFNKNKRIYIQYVEDELLLREIVCHELLHTWVYRSNEEIVTDLARSYPCYKSVKINGQYNIEYSEETKSNIVRYKLTEQKNISNPQGG